MKSTLLLGTLLTAALLAGCGSSLTDAEKTTAGHAIAAMTASSAQNTSRRMQHAAKEFVAHNRATGCTPQSAVSSGGFTLTITCPDTNTYKISMTSSQQISKTCGSDTFTIQDVTATFTFSVSGQSESVAASITATVNANPLACSFSESVNTTAGTGSVSADGFNCTYKGASLSQTDLQGITCS